MKGLKYIIPIFMTLALSLPLQPIESFVTDDEPSLVLEFNHYNDFLYIKNIL